LEVFLLKQVPQHWEELQNSSLSKEELTTRRQESLDKYYQWVRDKYKETQEKVYALDGQVVKNQMKVEAHQRGFLEDASNAQKKDFEDELQNDLAQMEHANMKIAEKKYKSGIKDSEPVDSRFKYAKAKQDKNIFEDDENDIIEISTEAAQESSGNEPEPQVQEVD